MNEKSIQFVAEEATPLRTLLNLALSVVGVLVFSFLFQLFWNELLVEKYHKLSPVSFAESIAAIISLIVMATFSVYFVGVLITPNSKLKKELR